MPEGHESLTERLRPHAEWWVIEAVLAFIVPSGLAAYLEHVRSIWAGPFLFGLGGGLMGVCIWAAIRGIFHLPPKRIQPNSKNIEACVHSWLDNHHLSIKKDPSPECYFRYRVTLDSGKLMTVVRMRDEFPGYVQILADLGIRGNDKKLLEQFTQEEMDRVIWDTRVELARAQVGYSGLENPPEHFCLIRRVPIHHNLTEFAFMSFVGSVEAAMNLVGLMYLKTKADAERRVGTSARISDPAPPEPETALEASIQTIPVA